MQSKELDFVISALAAHSPLTDSDAFMDWFEARREVHRFRIERIPFAELDKWAFEPSTGNLVHQSGKFFTVEGIRVETDFGPIREWSQPIINQPEIGILGILAKKFDGVLHFLMQLKMEPGNIALVQLAPTLQATRSNYSRVHQGSEPPYLSYFLDRAGSRVLVDVLQSEQGARFLRKRNRNIIVETSKDVPVGDDYCWLTLGQIYRLLRTDNLLNMDARTVLSCISFAGPELLDTPASDLPAALRGLGLSRGELGPFGAKVIGSALDTQNALHDTDDIISWFTELKTKYLLEVEPIPLKLVTKWYRDDYEIAHEDGKFFSVIAVRVQADNREVAAWTQPLLKPREEGIVAYIVKEINGVLHFLVQGKVEPGNFDVVEMAPTVQCVTGNYRQAKPEGRPAFLNDILTAPADRVRLSTRQSEEGGRFFQEQNRNIIVEVGDDFPVEVPGNFIWITLNQLKTFIKYNNFVNVEGRCLLACLPFS
ncbi:MAG: NDP-hexose 2,3-dehydratase family protein [Candidatus Hydrogenedentes bacterium]|nr:NDP-hexose 2,3-dehydratase family protein [Candidatus Hydrogenedentota bacterium]